MIYLYENSLKQILEIKLKVCYIKYMDNKKLVYFPKEVAEYLCIKIQELYRILKKIPIVKHFGTKTILLTRKDVETIESSSEYNSLFPRKKKKKKRGVKK